MNGILWAIVSGIGFGLFQSVHRRASLQIDSYLATFSLIVVSFIILLIAVVVRGEFNLLLATPLPALFWFGLSGIVHFFIGWTLLSVSQKSIGAARTSALIGTIPFFATILAIIFLGEILTWPQLIGIAMIMVGAYFVTVK